ncbi:MAG: ferritin-like domain-containing protein [Clostridiaceae bacterium]|nr:ferritin-like domain-containing protein [Clostridiaceae bacterium]
MNQNENKSCKKYLVDQPYPQIPVLSSNNYYATLLSGAFAGQGSEMTAIAQYTAHGFYLADYPEIIQAYECILYVEMHHLDILGKLIHGLGCHPKFITYETKCYWSGNYPVYAYELKPILIADIKAEKDAVARYTRLINQISSPDIQMIIRRIIADEQKHVEIFSGFLSSLK